MRPMNNILKSLQSEGEMKRTVLSFMLTMLVLLTAGVALTQTLPGTNRGEKMKIEVLYFESCPAYQRTIENLRQVIREEKLNAELILINVESPEEAEKFTFQGSTSVRINGQDMEGVEDEPTYACRTYNINGRITSTPTKEYLKEKIAAALK
jgi:hypothetical protein